MESRHPEFEALCGELLDGCLDEDGSRRLAELVAGEPALQELLREHLAISGALARENPMFNDERFETTVSTQIRALGFFGLLATGAHHQAHHLAIARGGGAH